MFLAHLPAGYLLARELAKRRPERRALILTGCAASLLHMALDSLAGGIAWLAPLSDLELRLVEVPARHGWWVWNFVLHWTMLIEVLILSAFAIALCRDLPRPSPGAGVAP